MSVLQLSEGLLAAWICEQAKKIFRSSVSEPGPGDGCTFFYFERGGKRFKVSVRECGEDI